MTVNDWEMNIDEAIRHCEEVAEEKELDAGMLRELSCLCEFDAENYYAKRCRECANEHRQLAEWLKELKKYRELNRSIGWSNGFADDRSGISPYCRNCSNHPINGGSGICHCILGNQTIC